MYMSVQVSLARKKYSIKYPDLYANSENCKDEESRKLFNCVQRGHQNALEREPRYVSALAMRHSPAAYSPQGLSRPIQVIFSLLSL
jgi:hypothetical protein